MPTDFPTQQQMNEFGHTLNSAMAMLPRIVLGMLLSLLAVIFIRLTIISILRFACLNRLRKQKSVLLQLIPPALSNKPPVATQELFSKFHEWQEIRPLLAKIFQQAAVFTPELVATREGGIRYILRLPENARESFEKDIAAYSTEIK